MRNLSTNEADIVRFTEMHGTYMCVGITMVQAARRLAEEGLVVMVSDDADEAGIGQCRVSVRTA